MNAVLATEWCTFTTALKARETHGWVTDSTQAGAAESKDGKAADATAEQKEDGHEGRQQRSPAAASRHDENPR